MRLTLLFFLSVFFLSDARAGQQDNLYTIRDVTVDVTAEDASKAQEQAILEGQRQAFERLIQRLLPIYDQGEPSFITDEDIAGFVKSFEILEEKRLALRYLANLTVRFSPKRVRHYLITSGLHFSEATAKAIVILPVYRTSETTLLWEDDNLWRKAWQKKRHFDGLVPVQVPLGDLTDIRAISATAAYRNEDESLQRIIARYQADAVTASIIPLPSGGFSVSLSRFSPEGLEYTRVLTVAPPADNIQNFDYVVTAVMLQVEEEWKKQTVVDPNTPKNITTEIPVSSLKDWVTIQQKLQDFSSILTLTPKRITKQKITVDLTFLGREETLKKTLFKMGLDFQAPTVSVGPYGQPIQSAYHLRLLR